MVQLFDLAMASAFRLNNFLENLNTNFNTWAGYIVACIGAIMMIAGIWKIGKGFISDRAQTNWFMAIAAVVLGGFMVASGYGLLTDMSSGVINELNEMGQGVVWTVDDVA